MHIAATRAFSLIEMGVVMAVLGLLGTLLVPCVLQAVGYAQRTACSSNLRQWGMALADYTPEHDGTIPRRGQGVHPLAVMNRDEDWFNALAPSVGTIPYVRQGATRRDPAGVWRCPTARDPGGAHYLCYAMNMYLSPWIRPTPHKVRDLPVPGAVVFMADGPGAYSATVPSSRPYGLPPRHRGGANLVFVDGHVRTFQGKVLGCGTGDPGLEEVQWQTGSFGVNQSPVP